MSVIEMAQNSLSRARQLCVHIRTLKETLIGDAGSEGDLNNPSPTHLVGILQELDSLTQYTSNLVTGLNEILLPVESNQPLPADVAAKIKASIRRKS